MRLPGVLIAFAALWLPPQVEAAPQTPSIVPGGALDIQFAGPDVYLVNPVRTKPGAGKACAAAQAYVDSINAGRFGDVADLFAPNGLLLHPPGHSHIGQTEIREFYESTIGPMRPEIVPVGYVGEGRECMVEIAAKIDIGGEHRFMLASVDHFTVSRDGKVTRMISYGRPRAVQPSGNRPAH